MVLAEAVGVISNTATCWARGETGISEATVRSPQKIAAGQGSRIGNR